MHFNFFEVAIIPIINIILKCMMKIGDQPFLTNLSYGVASRPI